jgi:butyryl-CoA dehydrogenase
MAAYQASLQYATERPQGRLPNEKDPTKPPILIIHHADVQRMLLTQKAIVEGALSLAMECNRLYDLTHASDNEEKDTCFQLLEILTPIVKTYSSEQGTRSAALAIQILGGYGFTTDFPVQQHYRDLKIMSLYEGTTGIQSIDLLGRKVIMNNGKALRLLGQTILDTCEKASVNPILLPYANTLTTEWKRLEIILSHLTKYLLNGDTARYLANANVFMEMAGYIVIGWQWLKQAVAAADLLAKKDFSTFSEAFLEGKIHTMEFFFQYELPHSAACEKTLLETKPLTAVQNTEIFT